MSRQNFFFTTNHNFFSKTLIIMRMNVMISGMSFLILNKYWECHEMTENLKIYSWSKHVKQLNECLMAMRRIWWHFRFLFGQTVFLNCLTECQTSCLGFSICLIWPPSAFQWIFLHGRIVSDQVQVRLHI